MGISGMRQRLTLQTFVRGILPRVEEGRALARSELRTLRAVAEVLAEGSPVDIDAERIADNVDAFLYRGQSRRAWRVRALMLLLEFIPIPYTGRRMSRLPLPRRRTLLRTKLNDAQRLWWVAAKIRYLVFIGIYGSEAALEATDYEAPKDRARYRDYHFPQRGVPERLPILDKVAS